MGLIGPVSNLTGFIGSRPPLVVFTLCLTAFAITTLSLAFYINGTESLPNPDVLDWNKFLKKVSDVRFCLRQEESDASDSPSTHPFHQNVSLSQDGGNVTISILASVQFVKDSGKILPNATSLVAVLKASDLHLPVIDRHSQNIVITFDPMSAPNSSLVQHFCVTFTGPVALLPQTKHPRTCSPLPAPVPSTTLEVADERLSVWDDWCENGAVMEIPFRDNPDLTVLLTMSDRSLVNLHLMHTSYFLFVMALSLVCYAVVKGKPKSKQPVFEKVPLDP